MWIVVTIGGILVFPLFFIIIMSIMSNNSKLVPEPSAGEEWWGEREYKNKYWERIIMNTDPVFNNHGNLRNP